MRRSRAVDWWLLATLLPGYLVMLAAGVHAHLSSGARVLPFRVTGAQGAHDYPLVWRLDTPDPAIQRGDRVLRLGNLDPQGLSRAEIGYRARPLLREGRPFEVELERGGASFAARVEPVPNPFWWWPIPAWASLALTAIFLLLRAPHWHLARRFFASSLLWCCHSAITGLAPVHPAMTFLGYVAAGPVAVGLTLWIALEWTESARSGPWSRALPWAIGLASAGSMAVFRLLTLPTGLWPLGSTRPSRASSSRLPSEALPGRTGAPNPSKAGSFAGSSSAYSSGWLRGLSWKSPARLRRFPT